MKMVLSLMLVVGQILPVAQPAVGQEPSRRTPASEVDASGPGPADGPLSRAILREAARLAGEPSTGTPAAGQGQGTVASPGLDWSHVRKLDYGTGVAVALKDGRHLALRLLGADESTLFGVQPLEAKLPGRAERVLTDVGVSWTRILTGDTIVAGHVRFSLEGIFDGDRKVANVQRLLREDIVGVSERPHSHAARNALIVLGAVLLGPPLVISLACAAHGGCQ
jgi:hypothetical protein